MASAVRALLVDDDPLLLALLSAFLESRGYSVAQASDGAAALARLEEDGCNLVITDRNMPRMDGLALCRAIRARHDENYVYCIMLTASVDEQSLVDAMEAGVDDYLAKPLRPAELGARLRAAERVLALEAGLAARNGELTLAYAQLSRDLELARTLQLAQLPPPATHGNVQLAGLFEPSSFVGGDLYDYFPLGDRLLAFYLADISGHGVAAAMMAVSAQHQLREVTQQVVRSIDPMAELGEAAVEIVTRYNSRFLSMDESGLYLTLVYGLLDRANGVAAIVHAGHPPALFAGPGSDAFEPIGEGSLPVGILPEPGYTARLLVLAPGSRLALYSDGVTDCARADGAPFGLARLQQALAAGAARPAAGCLASLRANLQDWHGGSFEDDVTLLLLESR